MIYMRAATIHGPRHAKTPVRAYADSEGPDQPVHPHSLIVNLKSAKKIMKSTESNCQDETLRMRRTNLYMGILRMLKHTVFYRQTLQKKFLQYSSIYEKTVNFSNINSKA